MGLAPPIVGQITDVCDELWDQGVSLLIVEERARVVLDIAEEVILLSLDEARVVRCTARPRP